MKLYFKHFAIILFAFVLLNGCDSQRGSTIKSNIANLTAPVAEKQDSVLTIHGDTRIDPYFWMRLTDEQKIAETPDTQTQRVLDYLNSENEYTDLAMKDTERLQENLYEEIVGRIKETDESLPYFENGYWYYTRYEEGSEYPIHSHQ